VLEVLVYRAALVVSRMVSFGKDFDNGHVWIGYFGLDSDLISYGCLTIWFSNCRRGGMVMMSQRLEVVLEWNQRRIDCRLWLGEANGCLLWCVWHPPLSLPV
jgi:hypothetical protein